MPASAGLNGLAPVRCEAELLPLGDGALAGRALERAVAALRHVDLVAPAQAAHPALVGQLPRGRAERIGHAVEDIGLAVAVAVLEVLEVFRRHELRQPDGAGPGRAHLGARHAGLQHLQRGEELEPELVLAAPGEGLRRQHADGVVRQLMRAVGGLAAPDGDHDVAVDAGVLLDVEDVLLVLLEELAPLHGERAQVLRVEILERRFGELGLAGAVVALAAGDDEIGQRVVGRQTRGRRRRRWRARRLAPRASGHRPATKSPHASASAGAVTDDEQRQRGAQCGCGARTRCACVPIGHRTSIGAPNAVRAWPVRVRTAPLVIVISGQICDAADGSGLTRVLELLQMRFPGQAPAP